MMPSLAPVPPTVTEQDFGATVIEALVTVAVKLLAVPAVTKVLPEDGWKTVVVRADV
jgi:hypothetical protein